MEHTKEQFLRHLFVWLKETDGEAWGTAIGLAVPCCPLIMRTARGTFIQWSPQNARVERN
jgi:hypothetical protein